MIDARRILDCLFMAYIAWTINIITCDIHKLENAIVNQHVCHVVGNPEEMRQYIKRGK